MPPTNDSPRPVFARPLFWLGALLVLLVAGAVAWFTMNELTRKSLLASVGIDTDAVNLELVGRVVDAEGRPAAGARVVGTWATIGADSPAHGPVAAICDAEGRYQHRFWFAGEHLDRVPNLKVRVTLRAHGRAFECEPSPSRDAETAGRSKLTTDFKLGVPFPKVAVHVRDAAGKPVTEFWISALPATGPASRPEDWPTDYKDFPNGVVQLGVPKEPFRVEVHRYRGADTTIVGPFDPKALPERIEITLGK